MSVEKHNDDKKKEEIQKAITIIAREWWRKRFKFVLQNEGWRRYHTLFWQFPTTNLISHENFEIVGFPFVTAFTEWQTFRTEAQNYMIQRPAYTTDLATAQMNALYLATNTNSGLKGVFQLVCDYQGEASDKKEFVADVSKLSDNQLFNGYMLLRELSNIKSDSIDLQVDRLFVRLQDREILWDVLLAMDISPNWYKSMCSAGPHDKNCPSKTYYTTVEDTGNAFLWIHRVIGSSITLFGETVCCLGRTATPRKAV
jgi:hypothetical protein